MQPPPSRGILFLVKTEITKRPHSLAAFLGFGAAVAATAWFGSRYSPKNPKTRLWYKSLDKPAFNPPDKVFPAVWSALYPLMAISGWRAWRAQDSPARSHALRLWKAQLIANAEWTLLFFGEHQPKKALTDAILLETLILRYIRTVNDVDKAAALTMVPYAAWTAFAIILNAEIARRNPKAETKLPRAA